MVAAAEDPVLSHDVTQVVDPTGVEGKMPPRAGGQKERLVPSDSGLPDHRLGVAAEEDLADDDSGCVDVVRLAPRRLGGQREELEPLARPGDPGPAVPGEVGVAHHLSGIIDRDGRHRGPGRNRCAEELRLPGRCLCGAVGQEKG